MLKVQDEQVCNVCEAHDTRDTVQLPTVLESKHSIKPIGRSDPGRSYNSG